MGKHDVRVGESDHVILALRSYAQGQPHIRTGKLKVRVGSLSCAADVAVDAADLERFLGEARQCRQLLAGRFHLSSKLQTFELDGEMAPQGHARVRVRVQRALHVQKDDPDWEVTAHFACSAESLPTE